MTSERRRARQVALQALFEVDQSSHNPVDTLTDRIAEEGHLSSSSRQLAHLLVRGVVNNKERIDEIIGRTATTWPVGQLAVTDRVALEIGIYEVCIWRETPVEVAINEAVELAKTFGGENSAGFVNGVLRTVSEELIATSHP